MEIHIGLRAVECLHRRIDGLAYSEHPQGAGTNWNLDVTARYHQTPLHEKSRDLSAFITADGLYQWTRVAMV